MEVGGCIEGRVLKPREDIEAAIEYGLPGGIGADAAGVEVRAGRELEAEGYSRLSEGALLLVKILDLPFHLLFAFSLSGSDQVHGHCIVFGDELIHDLQELDHVVDLVESTDIEIHHRDLGGTDEMLAQEAAATPSPWHSHAPPDDAPVAKASYGVH